MQNIIDVEGLRKSFGRTIALDGLDLAVRPGEVHGFLGPNGAGKSTTLRVLLGLLRADGGRATLLGSALLLAVAGAGAGLTHGARSGDLGAQLTQLIGAALIQVTAVWVVVGLTVAAYGFVPRATAYLGWIAVGICILLQELGPILKLSHWITDVSPFAQVPRAPGVAVAAEPLLVMTAIGAVLLALGLAGFRRRDVG